MECRCGPSTGPFRVSQFYPPLCVSTYLPACLTYVCMHLCSFMCACMYVNVCMCPYVHMCICVWACTHVCMSLCVSGYECMYVCIMTDGTYVPITTIQTLQFCLFLFPFITKPHFFLPQTPHPWKPLFSSAYPKSHNFKCDIKGIA